MGNHMCFSFPGITMMFPFQRCWWLQHKAVCHRSSDWAFEGWKMSKHWFHGISYGRLVGLRLWMIWQTIIWEYSGMYWSDWYYWGPQARDDLTGYNCWASYLLGMFQVDVSTHEVIPEIPRVDRKWSLNIVNMFFFFENSIHQSNCIYSRMTI